MSKRRKNILKSSSDDEIESDTDANKRVKPSNSDTSDSSSEGSDEEWTMGEGNAGKQKRRQSGETADNEEDKVRISPPSAEESWESGGDNKSPDSNGDESESESGEASESGSESQDESTSGGDEFNDGLNSDLIAGPEDRDNLDRMTEAEREQEIYRRLENRETLMERKRIYKQIQKEKRERERRERPEKMRRKSSKKKRATGSEERELDFLNEISRRSERKKKQADTNWSEAMDQLKQNRQLQREKQENEVRSDEIDPVKKHSGATKKKHHYTVQGVFGSGSEGASSDDESEDKMSQQDPEEASDDDEEIEDGLKKSERNLPISSVDEMNKIRMSRFRLDAWVHRPFFNELVIGSFVRIGIGSNEGRSVYRVAEVIDLIEGTKAYTIISSPTNKVMKLRHGRQERLFKMQFVSNSDITKSEFEKWLKASDSANLRVPTKWELHKRIKMIEEAKNMALKDADITLMVKEKDKYRKAPSNYAMAKTRLIAEKERAELKGDHEAVRQLTEKIQDLNERAEVLEKDRNRELTRISFINERNRLHNLEREEAIRKEMAAGREDDPFTRRKCAPKLAPIALFHNVVVQEKEVNGTQNVETTPKTPNSTTKPLSDQTPMPATGFTPTTKQITSPPATSTPKTLDFNGNSSFIGTPKTGKGQEDLYSAHDFDIQIDIPTSLNHSLPPMSMLSQDTHKGNQPRKSLNLSDYKKRNGLI